MTDPQRPTEPRLLALRMQGFKSFAERTSVEFGRGISAVVGPNGSGKSNLADALRWALGEQGRALRSRKSEDVIWAGSEKRAAQGMADVTLVIDNADGLLPVEFQVLELGRRLYRSGENDYLLNKSRIRLRDLVDLLDSAHLADNAFLFIGQGMVDQALALRPEERRPLFEEVAGVRRHERRRRRAEEQLVESEANLARVEDILGELRPQARRLAAQAEQQATRESTADELAGALLLAMHARWHEAAARSSRADTDRDGARAAVDAAMSELTAAEAAVAALSAELAARATVERERRDALEAARLAATSARLRDARLTSELDAVERDRRRLLDERAAAEAEMAAGRRALAAPVPPRDLDLEAVLGEAERELAHALAELGALRSARQAQGEELAALRRAAAARQAEAETARRRLAEVERRATDEESQAGIATERRLPLEAGLAEARARLAEAIAAEAAGGGPTREGSGARERRGRGACGRARTGGRRERGRGRRPGTARCARRPSSPRRRRAGSRGPPGGPAVADSMRTSRSIRRCGRPPRRRLAEATRAYVVGADAVRALATERGSLVVSERTAGATAPGDARERRFREALATAGGGTLDAAVRRDATGAARRILSRAAWLPDLPACLAIQASLPPGWVAVTRDGAAVVTELGVTFGVAESVLERRAEATRLTQEAESLETDAAKARGVAVRMAALAKEAVDAVEVARAEESRLGGVRRAAEEAERLAARELETVVREASWHEAQAERLAAELDRARAAAAPPEDVSGSPDAAGAGSSGARDASGDDVAASADGEASGALTAWEARAVELRARRDRLAEEAATRDAARRDAENRRARAEASALMAEERVARADRDVAALGERERALAEERDALRAEIASTTARETAAREASAEIDAADATDRAKLAAAETGASAARDRLRTADARLRATDHVELEARLGLEALHEAVVVELGGLGDLGIARLVALAGGPPPMAAVGERGDGIGSIARGDQPAGSRCHERRSPSRRRRGRRR